MPEGRCSLWHEVACAKLSCSRGGSGTGVERKEWSHPNEQMRDNLMEVAFKVAGHRCHGGLVGFRRQKWRRREKV